MPDDTIPPEDPPTNPMMPEIEDTPPIAKGKAQVAVTRALIDVWVAVARLEAVATALARTLDG